MLVTAILLQRGGPTLTPVERYLDLVDHIVRTGLPLTLFLDEAFRGRNFPAHVTVHHLTIRDLWLCKVIDAIGHDKIHIPAVRYEIKDTLDYLIIQNSKNELTARVDADRIAWIDAGVAKMSPTFERLKQISELPDGITIPGRADYSDRRPALIDDIMWRFCGSFFSGDRASIARFDVEHRKMILRLLPALTWDVNTWAHVEEAGFPFHWYSAGHNDSLFNFPITRSSRKITPIMLGVPVFREDKAMVDGAIQSFLDPLVDVVVVDNGASEEAKTGIATFQGAVEIIRNETNLYVNPAWNQIAERFFRSDAEILVLANADVLIRPGWAESLLARHECSADEIWFGRQTGIQETTTPRQYSSKEVTGVRTSEGGFFAITKRAARLVFPIPSSLLIWYGDDWIFGILARIGYRQVTLADVVVWHEWSVSQRRLPELNSILQKDQREWEMHLNHRSRRKADAIVRGKQFDEIEAHYSALRDTVSDFNEHMPILRSYAERVRLVTEFGVGRSSWALLHARPERLRCYDLHQTGMRELVSFQMGTHELVLLGRAAGVDTDFVVGNTLELEIEPTDLLFIDTLHTYQQLTQELDRHASKVAHYIVLHDTETYGQKGEDGSEPGLIGAVENFLAKDTGWVMRDRLKNNNGLTILKRLV